MSSTTPQQQQAPIDDALETALKKAVDEGNVHCVCESFGIPSNLNGPRQHDDKLLDTPLWCSTTSPRNLFHGLCQQDSRQNDECYFLVRALLWIPPWYDLPWNVVLQILLAFQQQEQENNSLSTCIQQSKHSKWTALTDIQTFLQESVVHWLLPNHNNVPQEESNDTTPPASTSDTTPRSQLLQLAQTILEPLFQSNNTSTSLRRSNHDWILPLEQLLPSLLSLCHGLDQRQAFLLLVEKNRPMKQSILDTMFPTTTIPAKQLLPWFTIASQVKPHLDQEHYDCLKRVLAHYLVNDESDAIAHEDYPGLIQTMVLHFIPTSKSDQAANESDLLSWYDLVLLVLVNAANSTQDKAHATYSTVETVLKSSVSMLSTPTLNEWINHTTTRQEQVPTWVRASMQLLLLQAIQTSHSQVVSNLLSRALGEGSNSSSGGNDLLHKSWNVLVQLAFPSSRRGRNKKNQTEAFLTQAQDMLQHLCYEGQGRVVSLDGSDNDNESVSLSTNCTKLIHDAIFLGRRDGSNAGGNQRAATASSFALAERSQLWVNAAQTMVFHNSNGHCSTYQITSYNDVLLAVWIVVATYVEIPESRATLVRSMLQCFLGSEVTNSRHQRGLVSGDFVNALVDKNRSALFCITLQVLTRTVCYLESRGTSLMEPLQPIADNVFSSSQPIPQPVFFRLATALSLLPCARTALLNHCRKNLQSPIGLWWGGAASGSEASHERVTRALHGLCALLPPCSDEASEDEFGLEARMMLSDLIALNQKPVLTVTARTWLYLHLAELVQRKTISLGTTQALLRACLMRFLSFCGDYDHARFSLLPQRAFASWGLKDDKARTARQNVSPRDDVVSLLRLVMALVAVTSGVGEERKAAVLKGRKRLMEMFYAAPGDRSRIVSSRESQDLLERRDRFGSKHDDNLLPEDIATSCLGAVLQCLIFHSPIDNKSQMFHFDDKAKEGNVCQLYKTNLIEAEVQESGHKLYEPKWIHSLSSPHDMASTRGREGRLDSNNMMAPLMASLCDVVIDFLVDQRWWPSAGEKDKPDALRRISRCVNSMILLRNGLHNGSEDKIGIHKDSIFKTSGIVYQMAVPAFQDLEKQSLSDTHGLIKSVLAYCDAIGTLLDNEEVALDTASKKEECVFLCATLWKLYLAIASEESSKRFIRYLEAKSFLGRLSAVAIGGKYDKGDFSLLTLQSSQDVDDAIRHIRFVVLSTLLSLLSALSDFPSISKTTNKQSSDSELSLSFWTGCLHTLSCDLSQGLKGDSGGIDSRMFSTYLDLLEGATTVLLGEAENIIESRTSPEIWDTVRESGLRLWKVACTVPLKLFQLFKRTMMLALHLVPAVYRGLERKSITNWSGHKRRLEKLENFTVLTFEQCLTILTQWDELDPSAVWDEVVGAEHTGNVAEGDARNVDDSSSDGGMVTGGGAEPQLQIPSVVLIPTEPREDSCQNTRMLITGKELKLRLPSSKVWSWAFCCAMLSMEKSWEESHDHLQASSNHDEDDLFTTSGLSDGCNVRRHRLLEYAAERESELCAVFRCVNSILDNRTSCRGVDNDARRIRKESEEVEILAVKLSSESKLRLCSLLEKMSLVLRRAIRNVVSVIKRSEGEENLRDNTDLVESLACLSAWFFQQAGSVDLTSGTRRWYHAEKTKKKASAKYNDGAYAPKEPVLRRLPKVISNMQELDAALQKLYGRVRKSTSSKLVELEEIITHVHDSAETVSTTLLELVSKKLKTLSRSDEFGLALLDDSEDESGERGKKRSRRNTVIGKQIQKERRKRVLRSRNLVVDEMLQRDREAGHDTGNDVNDAYVDLEDFLVEG